MMMPMDVEVPCDWTVNRRPAGHTAPPAEDTAPPPSKKPARGGGEAPAASSSIMMESGAAAAKPAEVERLLQPHPLGARAPIHATADKDDEPAEAGRVRALVMKHLLLAAAGGGAASGGGAPQHLDTESLLARLPYKRMLNDMFGGNLRGNLQNPAIPYVTRAYEEGFMRERTHSNERECAKGPQCECMFIDRGRPFVGVEFLLPGEPTARTPHMCVLCCRATTQQLYYDVMFDKHEFPGTIQRFGNIHSQPGEYALDAMLIAVPSAPAHIMPLPIVSHQRNRYTVFVAGGIKRLRQTRVLFRLTPSRSADDGQ